MNTTLYSDTAQYKTNGTILYTLTVQAEKNITSLDISFIPCTETYPDSFIIPNMDNITVSLENYSIYHNICDGIYNIKLDNIDSDTITLNIPAVSKKTSVSVNTSSVICDTIYSDTSYDTSYSGLTLNKSVSPIYTAVGVIITLVCAAAVISFFFRHREQ